MYNIEKPRNNSTFFRISWSAKWRQGIKLGTNGEFQYITEFQKSICNSKPKGFSVKYLKWTWKCRNRAWCAKQSAFLTQLAKINTINLSPNHCMRLTPTSTLDFLKQILADPVSTVSGGWWVVSYQYLLLTSSCQSPTPRHQPDIIKKNILWLLLPYQTRVERALIVSTQSWCKTNTRGKIITTPPTTPCSHISRDTFSYSEKRIQCPNINTPSYCCSDWKQISISQEIQARYIPVQHHPAICTTRTSDTSQRHNSIKFWRCSVKLSKIQQ